MTCHALWGISGATQKSWRLAGLRPLVDCSAANPRWQLLVPWASPYSPSSDGPYGIACVERKGCAGVRKPEAVPNCPSKNSRAFPAFWRKDR